MGEYRFHIAIVVDLVVPRRPIAGPDLANAQRREKAFDEGLLAEDPCRTQGNKIMKGITRPEAAAPIPSYGTVEQVFVLPTVRNPAKGARIHHCTRIARLLAG